MINKNNAGVDLDELLNIGGRMANAMFNLAQIPGEGVSLAQAAIFDGLRKQWDAARRAIASQISKDAGGVSVEQVPELPKSNDGKEQDAFEAWAGSERYDMTTHPMHWLFLNERTDAARQGWKAALEYVGKIMSAGAAAKTEQAPASARCAAERIDDMHKGVVGVFAAIKAEHQASAAGAGSEQQLFEADCAAHGKALSRYSDGSYTAEPRARWEGWQARAALARAAGAGSEQRMVEVLAALEELSRGAEIAKSEEWVNARASVVLAALARAPLPEQDDDKRDAARYRWLRNDARSVDWSVRLGRASFMTRCRGLPENMDEAIDAAMSASRPDDKGGA
jgi:hypothetical protein